jgi:Ala-tRNA(Pro) deacylase
MINIQPNVIETPATLLGPNHIYSRLDELGVDYDTLDHTPTHTVQDAKKLQLDLPAMQTKSLFLRSSDQEFFLVLTPADRQVPLNKLKNQLACGRLSLARTDFLKKILNVRPGAVTPFAIANDQDHLVQMVIDQSIMNSDQIAVHPLRNDQSTLLAPEGLEKFIESFGRSSFVVDLFGDER